MIITKLVNVLNSIGIILQEVKYMIYNEQNQQMEMTPTESQDKAVETLVFKLQEAIQDKETYRAIEKALGVVIKESMQAGYENCMETVNNTILEDDLSRT